MYDIQSILSPCTKNVYTYNISSCVIIDGVEMEARLVELKAFLQFLRANCSFAFDVNRFDHRIRLQKYVFIARFLGWDNEYIYNLYVRGPYSPDLAKDYYSLGDISVSLGDYREYLTDFDMGKFVQIISGKKIAWLEVGATMLSLYNNNKDTITEGDTASFLIARTKDIKSDYDEGDFIEQVFDDLAKYKLVKSS